MKSNEACGYIPPTPGYGPCTRDRGHEGPCAHEMSRDGRHFPELAISVREITRQFLDYTTMVPSDILFASMWGDSPTIITDGDRVMGIVVPVLPGMDITIPHAKTIASKTFSRMLAGRLPL